MGVKSAAETFDCPTHGTQTRVYSRRERDGRLYGPGCAICRREKQRAARLARSEADEHAANTEALAQALGRELSRPKRVQVDGGWEIALFQETP